MSSEPPARGSCLCGAIRFVLSEPPLHAGYCHCTRCQKRTGAAASPQARIDGRSFTMTAGADLLAAWQHPDGGFEKCFCSRCGSHLFSRNPDDPAQMSIRMSAFDGDPGVRPQWRT
ncbi:MAG TPA: GFA family protein, partial [Solirubrobacteraceae bacterium]|nr:GFA family protein [Solirubrobacteraceae bacterium]